MIMGFCALHVLRELAQGENRPDADRTQAGDAT
jgi:hypothetical protein